MIVRSTIKSKITTEALITNYKKYNIYEKTIDTCGYGSYCL